MCCLAVPLARWATAAQSDPAHATGLPCKPANRALQKFTYRQRMCTSGLGRSSPALLQSKDAKVAAESQHSFSRPKSADFRAACRNRTIPDVPAATVGTLKSRHSFCSRVLPRWWFLHASASALVYLSVTVVAAAGATVVAAGIRDSTGYEWRVASVGIAVDVVDGLFVIELSSTCDHTMRKPSRLLATGSHKY